MITAREISPLKRFFKRTLRRITIALSNPITRAVLIFTLFLFAMAVAIFFVEKDKNENLSTFIKTMWWFIVTITTVGYGDVVPITPLGKALAGSVILSGVIFISLVSGTVASKLVEKKLNEERGLGRVRSKNFLAILGWNERGEKLLENIDNILSERGETIDIVLVNELDENKVAEIKDRFKQYRIHYIRGDFTKDSVMERANLKDASTIMILSDQSNPERADNPDKRTIFATLTLKSMAPEVKIYAELVDLENEKPLMRAGADGIIVSGEFNPFFLSTSVVHPAMPLLFKKMLSLDTDSRIEVFQIPDSFVGKKFEDLFNFLRKRGYLPIALLVEKKAFSIDDFLSSDSAIDDFIRRKFEESGEEFFEEEKAEYDILLNPSPDTIIEKKHTWAFVLRGVKR